MRKITLILLALFSILSCDSDSDNTPSGSGPGQVEPLEGVFVLGSVGDAADGYWHDGLWHGCNVPDGTEYYFSTSICVSEDDVYVSGLGSTSGSEVVGYYQNNEWIYFENTYGSQYIKAIVVIDDSVYCAGISSSAACYWENGEIKYLKDIFGDEKGTGCANCIVVNNYDIYVAGTISSAPVYWKNDVPEQLFVNDVDIDYGGINTVIFHDDEMYAAGWVRDTDNKYHTGYWINGTWVSLNNPFYDSSQISITDIVFVNNDVYVLAYALDISESYTEFTSGYWKNGVWTTLEAQNGTVKAVAMVEHDGDIYIAGTCYENFGFNGFSASYAGYWKNGEWHPLGEEGVKTQAFDIVVK